MPLAAVREGEGAVPPTVAAPAVALAATASAIIWSGSLMARLTPDSITGLPANLPRSFTPTSVAKMTASAAAIVDGSSVSPPLDPWVSTATSTPARSPAATSESAAM